MFPFRSHASSPLPAPSYVPRCPVQPVLARADSRSRLRRSFGSKTRAFPSSCQLPVPLLPVELRKAAAASRRLGPLALSAAQS